MSPSPALISILGHSTSLSAWWSEIRISSSVHQTALLSGRGEFLANSKHLASLSAIEVVF